MKSHFENITRNDIFKISPLCAVVIPLSEFDINYHYLLYYT